VGRKYVRSSLRKKKANKTTYQAFSDRRLESNYRKYHCNPHSALHHVKLDYQSRRVRVIYLPPALLLTNDCGLAPVKATPKKCMAFLQKACRKKLLPYAPCSKVVGSVANDAVKTLKSCRAVVLHRLLFTYAWSV